MDQLTYFISDGLLVGWVGGRHFQFRAVSGGRAGSTTPGAGHGRVANNPWLTAQAEGPGVIGGPIPCGRYRLEVDPQRHLWIKLIPDPSNHIAYRPGSFAIHGHGPIGSHGCIVPVDPVDLRLLYDAVKASNGASVSVVAGEIQDRA